MAVVTLTNSSNIDVWLPDLLGFSRDDLVDNGGRVTVMGDATLVSILDPASAAGYLLIEATGTGFTYRTGETGEMGGPVDGTVTGFSIRIDGELWLSMTGLNIELSDLDHWMFGWERRGEQRPGDGFNLMSLLLSGNDTIYGSDNDDDIIGGRNIGNDLILAGLGYDFIKADAGNDTIDGGGGRDTYSLLETFFDPSAFRGAVVNLATGVAIDSWGGTDSLTSIEQVQGSRMSDRITGSAADESFMGLRGNDNINGGLGFDLVRYDRDAEFGGLSGVTVNLTEGFAIDGWGNRDTLRSIEAVRGTNAADVLIGNRLDNVFVSGDGIDTMDGGLGIDTLDFWDVRVGINVNLGLRSGQVINDGFGNTETLISIENVIGSQLNDRLTGSAGANLLMGWDGNDTISGGRGDDTIDGGIGVDRLAGGSGVDRFVFNLYEGEDLIFGDTILDFVSGEDKLVFKSPEPADNIQLANGTQAGAVGGEWFVFDAATDRLYYDEDGIGGQDMVFLATLTNVASLSLSDFEYWT